MSGRQAPTVLQPGASKTQISPDAQSLAVLQVRPASLPASLAGIDTQPANESENSVTTSIHRFIGNVGEDITPLNTENGLT